MPVTSCNKHPQYASVIPLELISLNFVEGRAWPSSLEKIKKKKKNKTNQQNSSYPKSKHSTGPIGSHQN